jgi:Tol biopolymer transport system component
MTSSKEAKFAVLAFILLTVSAGPCPAGDRNGRIAFVKGANVYTTTPDGANIHQLTKLDPGGFAELPSWEPDNGQIVYTAKLPDIPRQLWIMNANGRNQHRLLDDPGHDNTAGSFSPDGQSIIFSRCEAHAHGACAIHLVGIDGTGLSAITPFQAGVVDFSPVFSPDGRTVAFERSGPDGVPAIYSIGVDGSRIRRLTRPGVAARHPSWSPDGSRIALSCNCSDSGGAAIWIIDSGGGEFTQLSSIHATDDMPAAVDHLFPSWSPDGNFVAVEQRAAGTDPNVFIVDLAGAGPERQRFKRLIVGRQPSWSQAP